MVGVQLLFSGDVRTDQRSYVKTICTFLQIKHEQWDFSVMLWRKCSENGLKCERNYFLEYTFLHTAPLAVKDILCTVKLLTT